MSLTYVIVSYMMPTQLIKNISSIYKANSYASIIVVDNSPDEPASATRILLKKRFPQLLYIKSDINNRFHAYNLALPFIKTEWVTFRTDDDVFREKKYLRLLNDSSDSDFTYAQHTYNYVRQRSDHHRRPIETIIMKTAQLRKITPFNTDFSSDWVVMEQAFGSTLARKESKKIIMHKKKHGR